MSSSLARLETERPDPATRRLSRLPPEALARLLVARQEGAFAAARRAAPALAPLIRTAARRLDAGGRLILVGAGTSGRLAAQEAAECVPTFGRALGRRVVAVIAGGARALVGPVEGAEDDAAAARRAMRRRGVGVRDMVVGVSASGRTPFTLAALAEAKRRRAATALVSCNRRPRPSGCDRIVLLRTGPEPVAGSTRMKAGTATKIVLNALTTGAMVLLGRVSGNLMVCLTPTSDKLRDRAVRIVAQAAGTTPARARRLLAARGWSVARALGWE